LSRYGDDTFLFAYMKASINDPKAMIVIKNVDGGTVADAMEELRKVDPDAYANLSEFIVLPEE
jgi:hypothetical protein